MNTEPSSASALLTPLQSLWRWIMPIANVAKARQSMSERRNCRGTSVKATDNTHCLTPSSPFLAIPTSSRPLRIVRLMEVGQPSVNVGRMVISGRMADVCAELDRLVAREAALH
jgi:hypothetical protein